MVTKEQKILKTMNLLKKHFNYDSVDNRTTLNRMRGREDSFKILISCLLSLRARDEMTEKISAELFKVASTPQEILKIPITRLEKIIFSTGHYKKKARVLKHVSKELIDRFDSEVPRTREELMSIKGIGPKTANIVLCFAFNEVVIPVDVNVHRVSNRLGWVKTKKPEDTEEGLMKILPRRYWKEINGIFILHGKHICVPISPKCSLCPLRGYCPKIDINRSR